MFLYLPLKNLRENIDLFFGNIALITRCTIWWLGLMFASLLIKVGYALHLFTTGKWLICVNFQLGLQLIPLFFGLGWSMLSIDLLVFGTTTPNPVSIPPFGLEFALLAKSFNIISSSKLAMAVPSIFLQTNGFLLSLSMFGLLLLT